MLYLEGNTIRLTRGDSAYLNIPIILAGEEYTLQEGDSLTLSAKESIKDTKYAFQKVITGGNTIHIEPKDTAHLPFGKYKYDIQLNTKKGDVFTIIDVSTFEILAEVTC